MDFPFSLFLVMFTFFVCDGAMASMEHHVRAAMFLNCSNRRLIELLMGTDGAKRAVFLDGTGGAMRTVDHDNSENGRWCLTV